MSELGTFEVDLQIMLLSAIPTSGCRLALFTGTNGDTELSTSGTGYNRPLVPLALNSTPPVRVSNPTPVVFGPATAPWTGITFVGLYSPDGDLLTKRKLTVEQSRAVGETLIITAWALEVSFDA